MEDHNADASVFSVFSAGRPCSIGAEFGKGCNSVYAEQVIEGLDRSFMKMKKGEVALLTVAPEYAFGSSVVQQELAVIPANSTVFYEIELVSFEKEKESWDMNTPEKIEAVGRKKDEGSILFKAGKYVRVSKRYEKVVKYIEYDTNYSEEEKAQAKALKITCNLNDAA